MGTVRMERGNAMAQAVNEQEIRAEVERSLPGLQQQNGDDLLTEAAKATETVHRRGEISKADMISWQDIGDLKDKLLAKAQPIICTTENQKVIGTILDVSNTASVAMLLLSGGIALPMKIAITLAAALIKLGINTVCANYVQPTTT